MGRRLRFLSVIVALLVVISSGFFTVNASHQADTYLHRVDDIDHALSLADRHHLTLKHVSEHGLAVFETTQSTNVNTLLHAGFSLNQRDVRLLDEPNDPFLDDQYALLMMQLFDAWQITTGDSSITVAIIDTGIDTAHPEFAGRLSPLSYNAHTDEVGLEHVEDDHGHGTFVAGVLAANKNNDQGIAGIAQHVELMIIKANIENEEFFESDALIRAVDYAVANGADIINMSLGSESLGQNDAMRDALIAARDAGVFVVAAAGNDATNNPFYPAAFPTTVSVSSVDEFGALSSFSNFGETIDIAAPGTGILSTTPDDAYATGSGTSFAAPHVSGIIALMLSHFDGLDYEDVLRRLYDGASDDEPESQFGAGIVNAYMSLRYAIDFVVDDEAYHRFYGFEGESIVLPDQPTLDEHHFIAWYFDDAYTEPFADDAIVGDTTLYARFEPYVYHDVLVWDGDEVIDSFRVRDGESFTYEAPPKDGHDFIGFYADETFQAPYDFDSVENDLDLYLRYEPHTYEITLHIDGTTETVLVEHGTPFDVEGPERPHHDFLGWYLDDAFSEAYDGEVVVGPMDLYARFAPLEYTVTLVFDGDVIDAFTYTFGDDVSLDPIDAEGIVFRGWYLDDAWTEPFTDEALDGDLTLYAAYDIVVLTITFLDADGDVYLVKEVPYGESIEAPEGPDKPSDETFTYVFTEWSEPLENLTSDLTVVPQYKSMFKPEATQLNPGVDTIYLGETWVDEGVDAPEDHVEVRVIGNVDVDAPGYYEVRYEIVIDNEVVHHLIRMVSVLDKPRFTIDVELNPGITTLFQGSPYVEPGITNSVGEVVIEGTVDTDTPGTYTVRYLVTYEGTTVVRTRRIHVLPLNLDVAYGPVIPTRRWEGDSDVA